LKQASTIAKINTNLRQNKNHNSEQNKQAKNIKSS